MRKFLSSALALALLLSPLQARVGSLRTSIASPSPSIVQHIASSTNPVGISTPSSGGNNFKIQMQSTQAGNALVLAMTYPNGSAPTSFTDANNTWSTTPVVSKAGSSYTAAYFVLPNIAGGAETVTVNFSGAVIPFNYEITEVTNVATSSPANGSSSATGTGSALSAGAFTPTTNNDANGGNIILSYHALASSAGSNPTSFVPGGSFNLLNGDIAWTNDQGFPHASQYFVQAAQASVTPSITATGDTSDSYNSIAIALKSANAGSGIPAGIRVVKINHFTAAGSIPSTWNLQFPGNGNLQVCATANSSTLTPITSATDTDGNTWTKVSVAADEPQIFYLGSAAASPTRIIHFNGTFSVTISMRCFDIKSAASATADATGVMSSTSVGGTTSISNAPSVTPTNSNGFCLASMGLGQGPGLSVTSPTGATFDLVTYTGEVDGDLMENADALAHYYNPNTTQINWDWTFSNQPSNTAFATGVCFH